MYHLAGIAVAVAEEIMHNEIAYDLICIDRVFKFSLLGQSFQRAYQPFLISSIYRCFSVAENIGIAFLVVICVLQLNIVASSAVAAASPTTCSGT